MKTVSIFKLGLLATVFIFSVTSDSKRINTDTFADDPLISCLWVTYCGDPDDYSPILQPKDNKTEPQDGKDEKLA